MAPGPVDVQLVLAPGETRVVSEGGLRLTFDGVSGDSRCPADAMCVLGGDAIVQIQVASASDGPRQYQLHTGDMKPVRHDTATIALVQLAPYPFSAQPIKPADYRATLRITR